MSKQHQGSPSYVAAWERFDAAVAECRRLEHKHGLPTWGEFMEGREVRVVAYQPKEYVAAVAEWNAARLARNQLYEGPSHD